MPNPKRRHSNQRSRTRRAHDHLTLKSLSTCSNCGVEMIPHRICSNCGYYRGRQVITIKAKSKAESSSD